MDSFNMLVSGIINKEGRRFARVSIMRGQDTAEAIVPTGLWTMCGAFRRQRWRNWNAFFGRTAGRSWNRPGRSIP